MGQFNALLVVQKKSLPMLRWPVTGLWVKNIEITWVKVNEKFTLEQATKAQRGGRGIALLFL